MQKYVLLPESLPTSIIHLIEYLNLSECPFPDLTSPKRQYLHNQFFVQIQCGDTLSFVRGVIIRRSGAGENRPALSAFIVVCLAKRRALCKCNICHDVTSSCFAASIFMLLSHQVLFTSSRGITQHDGGSCEQSIIFGILIFSITHDICYTKSVNNFLTIHIT